MPTENVFWGTAITAWYLVWANDKFRLRSLVFGTIWVPREPEVAKCEKVHVHRKIPALRCTCGIYALKSRRMAYKYVWPHSDPVIAGQVSLWGRIIGGKEGYRAEFAYPLFLEIIPRWGRTHDKEILKIARDLQDYGVEVYVRPPDFLAKLFTETAEEQEVR